MAVVKVIKANKKTRRNGNAVVENIRVAPYCRVSTDSEEQKLSYNSQVMHYKKLVESNPKWDMVNIYADEGISGTQTSKRMEFQRMINDAVDGKIDMIITKSISRFARNTLDTLKYVRLLKEKNIAILFEKENINTLTMNGEMLLVILSSLAQQESESISANVKMGLKMKMKRGELVGYNGCLGYNYNKKDKSISINEKETEIVHYMFKRYVEGAGCFVISKELTKLGYKTRRGSTKWHESTIRGIIKNEKYKGDLLLGKTFTVDAITHRRLQNFGEEEKYYIENHHEAIISAEMFDKAQEILKIRSSRYNNKGRNEQYSRKYAFSSLCKCSFCGGTLIRRKWHSGTNHEKHIWQCNVSVKEGRKACPHSKAIDEKKFKAAFVQGYNKLNLSNKDMISELLDNIEYALDIPKCQDELSTVNREISKLEEKGKKLVELRINGKIDIPIYEKKYDVINLKLAELNETRKEMELSLEGEKSISNRIKNFRKTFNTNEKMDEFDREVFDSLVEKVIVGKEDLEGNPLPYSLCFILKTGLKFDEEILKNLKKNSAGNLGFKVPPLQSNEQKNVCLSSIYDTCRDRNKTTTERIYEIAVFSMGSGGFSFNRNKDNFLKKRACG
ncbi:MAG: recombinase family protein [Bacillota bacterium]|nr:recombinase family protein [Bacillota bacterium]